MIKKDRRQIPFIWNEKIKVQKHVGFDSAIKPAQGIL